MCCNSWGRKESDMAEQVNRTALKDATLRKLRSWHLVPSPHVSRRGRENGDCFEIYHNILFLKKPALRKNGFNRT